MPNYVTPSTMGYGTQSPMGLPLASTNLVFEGYPGQHSVGNVFVPGSTPGTNPSALQGSPVNNPSGVTGLPGATAAGNLAAGPTLQSLSDLINSINRNAQQSANEGRIPNDPALEAQSSKNIGSELQGQLPQDVVTQLGQRAAERGISMGSPGSDNSNSGLLRALGLTS